MSDDDLAGLEIPETPAGVPYRDREDAFALALLEVNGKPSDDAAVLALLDARSELFAGAAARLTGARGLTEAIPRLRDLAASPDDLLAVHAAAGLARLDPEAGRAELTRIAALPFEGAPGAIQAAGELARLGDSSAANTVYAALDFTNPVLRTIAAKQLLFLADASDPEALDRIGALLDDPDAGLAYIAISQLAALGERDRLSEYAASGSDEGRREVAAAVLAQSSR